MNARRCRTLFQRLRAAIPEPTTELEYATPFELLVSVILSAQATDKSVNQATGRLFKVAGTPAQVAADNPELKDVWAGILGTTDTHHYGRPFRFHYQAQAANWAGAWSRVEAPVLVLYGEYDWSESLASHQLIVDVVNRERPGSAELQVVPGSDHHFTRYASSQAAFDGTEGQKIGAEVAAQMIGWIRGVLRRP